MTHTPLTKAEREEIITAIARTNRPTRDYLPTDAADGRLIRSAPKRLLADLDAAEAERDAHVDEARELRSVLLRHNFAPCDTAACNCNGWHERSTGNGFYARFREIEEEVGEHDGQTLLDAVRQIVAERKAAVLWAEKAEKAMTCKGCGGTVGDHLAPDQGGCPGSFEIDGVQMVPLSGRDDAIAQRDRAESELDAERKMRVEAEAALDERDCDVHARIRSGYDTTVADLWRAKVAEVEAERDAFRQERDDLLAMRGEAEDEAESERDALKAKLAALLRTATDLREVAFDGPSEPKGAGCHGAKEGLFDWKDRINRESAAAIAAARGGAS